MSRRAPRHDIDEQRPRGRGAEGVGGGRAGGGGRDEARGRADGRTAYGADAAAAQPGRRVRLPGLRLAGPRPEPPAHRGVLRERRQGGHRGGDPAPGRPRRSSSSTRSTTCATRPTTGSASRAGSPSRWCCAPAATHYEPIAWDEAFELMGGQLNGLASPDEAVFYTSGKTSNEAAFAYQLFARAFGTNNLPDCSNMCHESTSVGAGRGDRHRQGLGQPRGHPRREADRDRRPEPRHQPPADAQRARDRQAATARRSSRSTRCARPGWSASRTRRRSAGSSATAPRLADLHLPVRINGDLALFQAIGALLLEWDARRPRLRRASTPPASRSGPRTCASSTGTPYGARPVSTASEIEAAARMFQESDATVICWAMGITQHRNAVATVKEIVNVALLQGNIGKPGAGLCPVRGHSNVQGDRTMGIWEQPPEHFLDALQRGVRLRPAARARLRHRRRRSRRCATARRRSSSGWAATSSRPPPTPRSPSRRCATPT